MNKDELFNFLKEHLKIKIYDSGTPMTCGGECPGNYGVKAELLLKNPNTGKLEIIDSDRTDLY